MNTDAAIKAPTIAADQKAFIYTKAEEQN